MPGLKTRPTYACLDAHHLVRRAGLYYVVLDVGRVFRPAWLGRTDSSHTRASRRCVSHDLQGWRPRAAAARVDRVARAGHAHTRDPPPSGRRHLGGTRRCAGTAAR